MGPNQGMEKKLKQAIELCEVVDKKRTGKVSIQNFLRIAQVCGLKIDNIMMMKHTNESKNSVDYVAVTNEISAN